MTTHRLLWQRPSTFRRRRFVASHRRPSVIRFVLKPFLLAVAMVGLPVASGLWVATSPRFRLSEVEIGATERVPAERIAMSLAPLQGRHLLRLSLNEVERHLGGFRWIEGATIRKQLPNRLVVDVRERRPVALLRRGAELFYVDRHGFVIGPYDPAGPVDLVHVSLTTGALLDIEGVLDVEQALARGAPDWSAALSEIEILGAEDFRIHTAALPFPVLVSSGGIERQLRELARLLPEIERRYEAVIEVDLRFSRQIVIQPAVGPRSQGGWS